MQTVLCDICKKEIKNYNLESNQFILPIYECFNIEHGSKILKAHAFKKIKPTKIDLCSDHIQQLAELMYQVGVWN